MAKIILYPTETVYGLGVDALDPEALARLYELKGREAAKAASWLVPDIAVIERYAELDSTARRIVEKFLPGPLTLILPAKDSVPAAVLSEDRTIGFRISSDPVAAELARTHKHPLTCTSANRSGEPTLPTPQEILAQFGARAEMIDRVIDDGPCAGQPSTVVRITEGKAKILREGAVPSSDIAGTLT